MKAFSIDPDITRAQTLPGWFYSDPEIFRLQQERVFAKSWQWIGDLDQIQESGSVWPVNLIDEPLLLTKDRGGQLHCYSNVCTHRGTILCETKGVMSQIRCRYHGRRFSLDGKMLSMPEFEGAKNFPSEKDNLTRVPVSKLGKFLFASLSPTCTFEELTRDLQKLCKFLPFEKAILDPTRSRDYQVAANWALYCDNFLEGFHIPYVHPTLSPVIDFANYKTELYKWCNVQIGTANAGEEVFPSTNVAGYYWWIFPNTMLNLYPWGISVNVVRPEAVDQTKVSYLTYVWDETKLDKGAGSGLDQVEHEDEAVVESVQRGTRARLYDRGRYSPTREQGVHHFHRLLQEALQKE